MMTTVTHVKLRSGREPAWDAAFRKRVASAHAQPGWIAVQICIPTDAPNERVIIGTWETRAHWEAWHGTTVFKETRGDMEGAEDGERKEWWHEVLLEDHR